MVVEIKLVGKEKVEVNPGNKGCRICGALILDEVLVRSGCTNRHTTCIPSRLRGSNKSSSPREVRARIKSTGRVNRSRYQVEE